MSIEEYFGDWIKYIDVPEMWKALKAIKGKNITPGYGNIFRAFHLCPYKSLKAIFIGQDPYPQKNIATGLAFANEKEPLSPSLEQIKNSVINLEKCHYSINFVPDLVSWANQGILLLNSALTTEIGKSGVHLDIWRPFMKKFIEKFSEYNNGTIWALFGKEAQFFIPYMKNQIVLKYYHPAYYVRNRIQMPPKIFEEITEKIKYYTGEEIKWFKTLN